MEVDVGRLDDARQRLAAAEAARQAAITPAMRYDALLAEVSPMMERLVQAVKRHVPVPQLRQRFAAERAAQFATYRQAHRRAHRRDFRSGHALQGDFEEAVSYTGLGLWLNGDGPGGLVLHSALYYEQYEPPRHLARIRLSIDLDASSWEVRERVTHYAHVGGDTYEWQRALPRLPQSVNEQLSSLAHGNDDQLRRFREAIDACVVQLIDFVGISQSEVEV